MLLSVGQPLYALLDGADFGAGLWDLLAGGNRRGRLSVT
jgi:cytochrome d ubiquinol oxidase subunit II